MIALILTASVIRDLEQDEERSSCREETGSLRTVHIMIGGWVPAEQAISSKLGYGKLAIDCGPLNGKCWGANPKSETLWES